MSDTTETLKINLKRKYPPENVKVWISAGMRLTVNARMAVQEAGGYERHAFSESMSLPDNALPETMRWTYDETTVTATLALAPPERNRESEKERARERERESRRERERSRSRSRERKRRAEMEKERDKQRERERLREVENRARGSRKRSWKSPRTMSWSYKRSWWQE